MDIGDFHSGVAQNQALNDLTNSNGKRTRLRTMEQSIHGNCDEKVPEKRKRFSHGRLGRCDQRKEENFRSTKPHETKGKALSFMNANPSNLLGKGYDEPKGPVQIDSISFQGCSSDQENRLKYEADDDSSTVLAPQYNSEADDSSTESDKHKDNYPMTDGAIVGKPFSSPEQNQPAFSMCNIDTLTLTKNAADNDNLTYAKSQYISLCGSCPCSSCVKAAYMWTDLLYQDAKGRLSVEDMLVF
ncbi:hypothetical protein AXF42_Ash017899 [Apostasia shenzhenica]|uniref:Uncharacterized protein n=1 Tax=Apostasia shenzhenica TaxID=1088818 RepID=A0A2I0AY63_9ASPA|nr:hypothetical protein AXF42_Ash017899 [Apostasia shenzhenica]